MCYAIPGKINKIDGRMVTVEYFGQERRAHNEFDDLNIGDYIYAQGGYVIKKIPAVEAESILSVWFSECSQLFPETLLPYRFQHPLRA